MALIDINVEKPSLKRTEIVEAETQSVGGSEAADDDDTVETVDDELDSIEETPKTGVRQRLKRVGAVATAAVVAGVGVVTFRKFRARRRGDEQ